MQEEQTKHLVSTKLPEMLSTLIHSNQFLKIFSLSMVTLLIIALFTIFVMSFKEPTVVALSLDGKEEHISYEVKLENQVTEAIKKYLEKRYHWNEKDVIKKLKEAEDFISPQARKAFQESVAQIAKFSIEKIVGQKLYPEQIKIDPQNGTALITGDRITSIQGLKAVGDLKLELTFESGRRTRVNPWGIYILKEKEE